MKKKIVQITLALLVVAGAAGSYAAFRLYRTASIAKDWYDQVRYQLVEIGGVQVGTKPAAEALSPAFLAAIFGDNPKLLKRLTTSIAEGISDPNKLQLTEIAAMLVTYRLAPDGQDIQNLCITNIGSYKANRLKPGFHRDGFFQNTLDRNLWSVANTMIGFLGRDVDMIAEEDDKEIQARFIDSLFTGQVSNIVDIIQQPLHYTLVLPNPRKMLPPQLRPHIGTLIFKGSMEHFKGDTETIFMCGSSESARYTESVLVDMKLASETILRNRFGGVAEIKPWGPHIQNWWAFEMVMTSEQALLRADENLVRFASSYGRVMNNAILKTCERMGRDLLAMTKTLEERKDPRQVDEEMKTRQPSHRWTEEHKWGPNWPIPAPREDTTLSLSSTR